MTLSEEIVEFLELLVENSTRPFSLWLPIMKTKEEELKEIEEMERELAARKAKLAAELEAEKEQAKWYDEVLQESPFDEPRDLIKALMLHFNVRSVSLESSKAAAVKKPVSNKRHRTKMDAALRDAIKGALAGGATKSKVCAQYNTSFAVVQKVLSGMYDHL